MPTDAPDDDRCRSEGWPLLRTYAEVVTPATARGLAAGGSPQPNGRLLSEVLEETRGQYTCVLDGFSDRILAGLRRHVDDTDDPAARAALETGRLVIPFEHLRGLDPETTRVRLGFSFGRHPV